MPARHPVAQGYERLSAASPIRIHIQRILLVSLCRLLKSARIVCIAAVAVVEAIAIPFRPVFVVMFRYGLVPIYKGYLKVKSRLGEAWRPAKNRLLFSFSTRYVVHGMLILLTLFVATNSLKAREVRTEDFNSPPMLLSMLSGDTSSEVVETTDAIAVTPSRHYGGGIGGISPYDAAAQADFDQIDAATSQDASSLIKPGLTSTDNTPLPRDGAFAYVVEDGDTVGTIALKFHISINTILYENRITANDFIKPGQKLTILPVTGVSHQVQARETLAAIANTFKADQSQILEFNKLANADQISVGDILIVPGGTPPAPTPAPSSNYGRSSIADNTPIPQNAPAGHSDHMLWPTTYHKINQGYRGRFHTGVDIDADTGNPIYAAESGTVTLAGWYNGYGLHIRISHGGGIQTLYGHASRLLVKEGQYVTKGQVIALAGSTGHSTGPHLHFEVRINGAPVNPFNYL